MPSCQVRGVRGVRSVELVATNLEEATRYYETVWNLQSVETRNDARYFRGTCGYRHVLGLHAGAQPEYAAEVLRIDDSYVPRSSDFWKFAPGRSEQWGITQPRSARYHRVQRLFGFTADGDRLS